VAVVSVPVTPEPVAPGAAAGAVPPPRLRPATAGWLTFKIFGAADRQDDVLLDAVAPAVRAGMAEEEIDRWFFIRYVDGPGRRPHLRVRVHEARPGRLAAWAARLGTALAGARAAGALATVET